MSSDCAVSRIPFTRKALSGLYNLVANCAVSFKAPAMTLYVDKYLW